LRRSGCGCIYDVKEKGSMFRQNRVVLLSYNYFRKEKKMFLNWVLILYEISPFAPKRGVWVTYQSFEDINFNIQ
jgi:hypothetical protein